MKQEYNIVELFSGIGSQAKALKNIGLNINVQATCEWDMHAFIAYDAIHSGRDILPEISAMTMEEVFKKLCAYTLSNNGKEPMNHTTLHSYGEEVLKRMYTAIIRDKNLVDISKVTGKQMPENTDIMTYSFPCQDLSNVGAFHGYNKGIDKDSGSRSSLLWQVGRILTEMTECGKQLPRYLVMENVPTLLSERHVNNFIQWKADLEDLGYYSQEYQLNAKEFGIPQNRPRLLMFSVFYGDDTERKSTIKEYFDNTSPDSIVNNYVKSTYYRKATVKELLRLADSVDSPYWQEAVDCTPNDTPSRRKIWEENKSIEKGVNIHKRTAKNVNL